MERQQLIIVKEYNTQPSYKSMLIPPITSITDITDTPLCKCGCGEKVNFGNTYIHHHYSNYLKGRKRILTKEHILNMRKEFTPPLSVYTKDFCYLIGVCFGDAYLGIWNPANQRIKKTYTKYTFRLITKDKDFIDKFRNGISNIFNINPEIQKVHNKKYNKDFYSVSIQSANLIEFMFRYQTLDFVKSLNDSLKIEVLRGLFDSEGSITTYKRKRYRQSPNKKYYNHLEQTLLVRISQAKKSKGFEVIKYLLDHFKIDYKYYPSYNEHDSGSFNLWCKNGFNLLTILGDITIKRKDISKYKPSEKQRLWTDEETNLLIKLRTDSKTFSEISKILNRTISSMKHRLIYIG